jgi:hypothetical protein
VLAHGIVIAHELATLDSECVRRVLSSGKHSLWAVLARKRLVVPHTPRTSVLTFHPSPAVIQELGREGVLPCSSFFASNKPFNAPLPGLLTQYLISMTFLLAVPPGDAYLFMISSKATGFLSFDSHLTCIITASSYCLAIINTLVSAGLLLLYTPAYRIWGWNPPFRAPKFVIILFTMSNVFLVLVPLLPPSPGSRVYDRLPYWVRICPFQ